MADTRDFLLELGCEEMPSSLLMKAQEQLGKLVKEGAKDVYTHAPHDGGFERLEWALNS